MENRLTAEELAKLKAESEHGTVLIHGREWRKCGTDLMALKLIPEIEYWRERAERLQAEAAAMRDALDGMGEFEHSDDCPRWYYGDDDEDPDVKCDCGAEKRNTQKYKALSSNAGKSILERLRAAEKVVEAAYDYVGCCCPAGTYEMCSRCTLKKSLAAYDKAGEVE